MELSEREQRILQLIQQSAHLTVEEIGKILNLRAHLVRSTIAALEERLEVRPYAPINTAILGFTEFHIFTNLTAGDQKGRQRLLKRLQSNDRVALVIEHAGQMQFSVWARSQFELGTVLDSLLGDLPLIQISEMVVRHWYRGFGVTFESNREYSGIMLGAGPTVMEIDEFEHEILKAISRGVPDSASVLQRVLGKPSTTIEYRLRKLRERGILLPAVFVLDHKKTGRKRFVTKVKTGAPKAVRAVLIDHCRRSRDIVSIAEVSGSWNFEIGTALFDDSDINSVVDSIGGAVASIPIEVHVNTVVKFHKITNYPFDRFPSF